MVNAHWLKYLWHRAGQKGKQWLYQLQKRLRRFGLWAYSWNFGRGCLQQLDVQCY
jgi:hypothetical protein